MITRTGWTSEVGYEIYLRDGSRGDELWERMWASSIDVPGPEVELLVDACREHRVVCAIGVNERESERPGTLYNSLLYHGPDGVRYSSTAAARPASHIRCPSGRLR